MKTFRVAAVLAAFILTSFAANATHLKGGNVYFKCMGGGYYKLVFTCYYACEPFSALPYFHPGDISFRLNSSCSSLPDSIFCTHLDSLGNVPNYCPGVMTTCDYSYNGGSMAPPGTPEGTLLYVYTSDSILLPPGCTVQASIDYSERNAAISNLVSPASTGLYLPAVITVPTDANECGFSPVAVSTPTTLATIGSVTNMSYAIVCQGMDSLIYEMVSARNSGDQPIPYVTGCDSLNPLGVGGSGPFASAMSLDRHTGMLTLTPTVSSNVVLAVGVTGYKGGVKAGNMIRDYQLSVVPSAVTNAIPGLISKFTNANVSGGLVQDSITAAVCPGSTMQLTLAATDPDANNYLYDSTDAAHMLHGAIVSVNHRGTTRDTAILHISWTPQASDTGYHSFALTVRDSSCPQPGIARYNFVIRVINGLYAGLDQVHCISGQPTVLHAAGGDNYNWSDVTGAIPAGVLSYNADSSIITVAPSVTSTYVVSTRLGGQCRTSDTVIVRAASLYTLNVHAQDSAVCRNTGTTLTVTASPANLGPFSYSWQSDVASPHTASTATGAIGANTTYHVDALSAGGCAVSGSVTVRVSGAGPHIMLSASQNNVCPGDTVRLNAYTGYENTVQNGTIDTCPSITTLITAMCYGPYDTIRPGSTAVSPFDGSFYLSRVQYLFHPAELYAAGMTSGAITDISFYVKSIHSTYPYDNFYVSVGPTTMDSLSSFANGLNDMATYSSYTPHLGWNTFPFAHFYNWDGASNIIVQVCYSNTNTSNTDEVAISSIPSPGGSYYLFDYTGAPGNGCTLSGRGYSEDTRPAVRFGMCVPQTPARYLWSPHTSGADTLSSAVVVTRNSKTYSFTAIDPSGCSSTDSIAVHLNSFLNPQSSSQVTICQGDTAHLNAFNTAYQPSCTKDYLVSSIPYAPMSGTAVNIPNSAYHNGSGFSATDDGTAGPFYIPFAFPFYCNSYNQIYVNTNGWISFVNPYASALPASHEYTAQTLPPTATDELPLNMIGLVVGDYQLSGSGGNMSYFTTGTAPARTFVVKVNALPGLGNPAKITTGEIQLHEADGSIDILIDTSNFTSNPHTTGIKDSTGYGIAAPGRNNVLYTVTTPEAWHFAPRTENPAVQSILWTPGTYLSHNALSNPSAYPPTTTQYVANSSVILHPNISAAVCHVSDTVTVNIDQFNHTLTAGRLNVCAGDTTQLHFNTANTLDSIIWSPATGLSSPYIATPVDTAYGGTITYTVNAKDAAGCRVKDSIRITSANLSVWPGDANDDHVVNNNDLLYIGIAYGDTGPVRSNASLVWVAQCADVWNGAFANGVNHSHADCNGDGVVGYDDTTAIYTNWGLTHAKTEAGRSSNLNMTITTDKTVYDLNDVITASIAASDASNPLTGIYGIAYKFEYTSHGVAHILSADQSMSWVGRKLDMRKIEPPLTAYMAQSRIDHRDTAGYGKITEIRLKVDGVTNVLDSGYLSVNAVLALNKNGDTVYLNAATKTIAINGTVGIDAISADQSIEIYPNPNKGIFTITQSASARVNMVMVDAIGREVYTRTLSDKVTNLDLSTMPDGVYLISFSGASGRTTKRLVIAR